MRHGFLKVATFTPKLRVADPFYNAERICECISEGEEERAKIMVFPELCITGYTCGDLFLQEKLLSDAKEALKVIVMHTDGVDGLVFVGLPIERNGKLYNVAAVINCGDILGFVPKINMPNYGEFYEVRHFTPGNRIPTVYDFEGDEIPFGTNLLFNSDAIEGLSIACELCEDLWVPDTPSTHHVKAGADIIVNLSASNELVGKTEYRRNLVASTSARLVCGYIYASAGSDESTQDTVYGADHIIAENGSLLVAERTFEPHASYTEIDVNRIRHERRRMTTFPSDEGADEYMLIDAAIIREDVELTRDYAKFPFVPSDERTRSERCEDILSIQSQGLKKRLVHIGCKTAVIGVSGGLDSTLALIVAAKAFDLAGLDRSGILAVTMPCFGTTDRTYNNAINLAKSLGATLKEIDIKAAVTQHFKDIGQDPEKTDVTYENCQARERTQVLMDIANKEGGIVIGTGDMSELALGWATYNGDHMSMYGVNCGVPKTLVRHLVKYFADTCEDTNLSKVLNDVLDTPVSPELIPPKDGKISQKTENIVGPYELHDFFLYYMLRAGFTPEKVYRVAVKAFEGEYDEETVLKWLKTFYRRFFSQQFKRSCLPDGPKVGSVALSPRGDLRMPSDACADIWLDELEDIM